MLTRKQQQTYQFIRDYITREGMAPTEAEIALGIGIQSRGVVHRYVKALEAAGLIELIANKRRNIRLIAEEEDSAELPIIGRIAAGLPIEAMQDYRSVNLASTLLGPNRFILEVKGDSMIGDNICDGDYIICESRSTANPSDIAVVLIAGEEASLKRVQKNSDGTVTLLPSNPHYSPMVYPAAEIQIQGIYIGLLRLENG